ncbi:MAG: response regulator, partial [Halobacteria archaeon]|nr:response regulator [Halobacteria archaeon]
MRNSNSKIEPENIRVLHVDDNSTFANLTASHLEQENDILVVEIETSASEALETLENDGSFDCIVSDYEMPGMDGLDFLNEVRDSGVHSNIPFILFTGKGNEEIASDAISKGVTDYLQKKEGGDQYKVLANRIVNNVERYRAEKELKRGEERLRQIIDLLPQFVFVTDREGK